MTQRTVGRSAKQVLQDISHHGWTSIREFLSKQKGDTVFSTQELAELLHMHTRTLKDQATGPAEKEGYSVRYGMKRYWGTKAGIAIIKKELNGR